MGNYCSRRNDTPRADQKFDWLVIPVTYNELPDQIKNHFKGDWTLKNITVTRDDNGFYRYEYHRSKDISVDPPVRKLLYSIYPPYLKEWGTRA